MSGTLTCGQIIVSTDSLTIDQLTDVTASAPVHDDVIIYKDNVIDPLYATGWHSTGLLIENFTNVNSDTVPAHNEILVYNENAQDGAYPDGWVNKNISAVFTGLNDTIAALVSATDSIVQGQDGNAGEGDMIMFTNTVAATGVVNVSIGSCFNNNSIFKKELTDSEFSFVQELPAGSTLNTTYPVGTILRSTKGLYGFSGPIPTPLGIPSLSFKLTKFSVTDASSTVLIASLGIEVTVTLFESDGTTIVDGPTVIASNNVQSFACNAIAEFVVSSSGNVVGYVNENGSRKRLLVPMTTDILVHNRNHSVSSLSGTATVDFYQRNGTSGTDTVTSGTPQSLTGAGSNNNWGIAGWMRLRSDVPISVFQNTDASGAGATPGWPVDQLAQCFPNPSFMDLASADYSVASISICSPYEGTATIYDNTGTEIDSFNYTRTTAVVTGADQLEPAAGRWRPSDLGTVDLDGGYVSTNTPAVCVMNFNGSAVWTGDIGEELIIPGTTPEDVRAEIRLDASGIARRRDISALGDCVWTVV